MKKLIMIILIFSTASMLANEIEKRLNIVSKENIERVQSETDNSDTDNSVASNDQTAEKKMQVQLPTPAAEDKILLESAINYFNSGEYNNALSLLKDLEETYAASLYLDQAKIYKAKILSMQSKEIEAINTLSTISKDSGEYPAALYMSGQIYLNQKNYPKSKEMFQKVAMMFPGNNIADDALLKLGQLHLKTNSGNEALTAAVSLIKNYPDRETLDDAYFLLANIYMKNSKLRDLQKTRNIYRKFIYFAETQKDPIFSTSPLLPKVKSEYNHLNSYYFNESN